MVKNAQRWTYIQHEIIITRSYYLRMSINCPINCRDMTFDLYWWNLIWGQRIEEGKFIIVKQKWITPHQSLSAETKQKKYHDGQEYQNQDWIEFIYWVNQDSVPRFFITSCSISARAHRQNSWWYNTFGTESWWRVYLNEPHVEGSGGRGPLEHSMDLVKDKNFMLALDVLAQDRRYRVSQNTVKTRNTDVNVQCFFLYNLCKYSFIFSNTWYLKMAELMTFLLFCFSISSYYRMVRFKGPDRTTAIV